MAIVDASTGPAVIVAVAVVVVVVSTLLWTAMAQLVWRPYAVGRALGQQGVRGPAYRLLVGNIGEANEMRAAASGGVLDRRCHDVVPRVLPHYRAWMSRYGKVFVSWTGPFPALCVGDYAMAKEILADRTGLYAKPDPGASILALFGNGLAFVNGDDWARHRRVVHPAFAMDKLKMMAKTMAECARKVIQAWEARAAAAADGERMVQVEVGEQFQELTADVISHTAFGSSYRQGKEVFVAQRELQYIAMSALNSVRIPGSQYIPTKANIRRRQLAKKVRGTLMAIIRERQATAAAAKEDRGYGNDLLGLMLEANAAAGGGEKSMTMDEIVDECKTFFFAGHDTTSHLLTWAMFLLGTHPDSASARRSSVNAAAADFAGHDTTSHLLTWAMFLLGTHPEWQHRLREEVLRECGGGGDTEALPNGDALNKLKLMTMVLYETLRLYGPVSML
uniref:Cytochrome P450 n=1 Tax=Oryza rufipogon TaxID=4529 RepID=A0A0E0PUJ2_ORYRU